MGRKALWSALLCSMLLLPGIGAAKEQSDAQAAALHALYILKGDGSEFQLQSRLERSEATAFVVRLAGGEREALDRKGQVTELGFVDVAPDDWYAPYVDYALESGIISGFPDETFRADEYVSEREFVKMVLAVLDYHQGEDFEWREVYEFAQEIGLLQEPPSAGELAEFTKEGVVAYLYQALQLPRRGAEKLLIEELVASGAVSAEAAQQQRLLPAKGAVEPPDFKNTNAMDE